MVEYALLVAMIALVCIGAVTFLGQQPKEPFSAVGQSILVAE
jgi:pilus assembly protein Flp/PilA